MSDDFDWLRAGMVERIAHVTLNADRIYVRAKIKGKWQSVALADLPHAEKISETKRLIRRDVEPTLVIS
jgi:hypothetical protein